MHVTPVHQSGLLDIKSEKIDNKYYRLETYFGVVRWRTCRYLINMMIPQ